MRIIIINRLWGLFIFLYLIAKEIKIVASCSGEEVADFIKNSCVTNYAFALSIILGIIHMVRDY